MFKMLHLPRIFKFPVFLPAGWDLEKFCGRWSILNICTYNLISLACSFLSGIGWDLINFTDLTLSRTRDTLRSRRNSRSGGRSVNGLWKTAFFCNNLNLQDWNGGRLRVHTLWFDEIFHHKSRNFSFQYCILLKSYKIFQKLVEYCRLL